MFRLIFILILFGILWGNVPAFEVRFLESYPNYRLGTDLDMDEMRLHKRDIQQFFDKASFSFNGLVRVASVPVPFPLDICMLQLPTVKYATTLHKDAAGVRHFAVYVWRATEQDYALMHQQAAPQAVALDCLAYAGLGYVALSYNHTEPVEQASDGSPIYELTPDGRMRTVQYFADQRLRGMYLRISSQELTLLQAYEGGAKKQQRCPYFKWTGGTFQRLGSIPCSNARRLEAFGIDYADYVAVANYASADGRTSTHSEIYKYDASARRFQLFQRLRSNGAVDVKYFSLPVNEVSRRHFLILGNTVASGGTTTKEADTVIYVYDKGQFVPYQRLSFFALERFLPVTHVISEKFLLFVACNKQDVKIYNLNDWKFEESTVQFTEGAFSRGVARMRSYTENEQSYLVIANENMAANETNIFQPLYKQDEHANVLRQEIIDWAREQTKRLEQVNVEQLVQGLQQKLKERKKRVQQIHVKRVNTKSFVDVHQRLTTNYWDALQYAKRALDIIEQDVAVAQRQPVKRAAERQTRQQHEFDEITVGTLLVHDKLNATLINGVNQQQPVYELVNASKVYVSEEYKEAAGGDNQLPVMEQLNLQDLHLDGNLNGLNWTQLLEQTLKRRGSQVQFIKAPVDISNLKADAILVNSNEINDRSLGQLISIDGGDYIVQQDVQFAQPIEVNKLIINQRLNHIHVHRQRFDVLLHQANHTQIIEGVKRFENIRVLEPITIAGQMLGAELHAMSPMKVTHQSLELQGDYVIDGDVTISQRLQVQDLLETNTQRSAAKTLQQALRIDQHLVDVNLRFEQPLSVNNTQLSFVNAADLQQLVQLNVDEVQVVEGVKLWPHSLTIRNGFGEVNILNDIQVDQLSQQLLLKSSNQSLKFPLQLFALEVPQLNATVLQLHQLKLHDYMRHTGVQRCNGNLYVDQLQANQVDVTQLHMHGTLFGHPLNELYEQGAQRLRSWQLPANFNGTIHARNVWLKGYINNASVTQVEQQLQQLAGNIKYVGDFTFRHAVNISNLSFASSLNGIQAERFGRCWLESSGDQQFTAKQTLAAVASEEDVLLQRRLNNYTLEQLVSGSYRLNGSEQLQAVKFVNPIVLQNSIKVGRVNGLRVPEDMLYVQAGGWLQAPLHINGNLLAQMQLCNVSNLNGFQLETLTRYLRDETALETLHVEQAQFESSPIYDTLNGRQLQKLLDDLWLDNEHVELKGMQLTNCSFEGLLEFEGTLNGLHVEHIGQNYFSRTRSQHLNVPLSFEHDVTFAQPLTAKQVQLRVKDGALVEGIGNVSLNFNDFVLNTLKTAGVHIITGQWIIPEAEVAGDLSNVLINQLNLVDDILRNDTKEITLIDAPKSVESAAIKRLFATSTSTVANVPVAQWINDTVYIYGNHTIAGTTILDTLNLYNDLRVMGPVNGIQWQPDELLLCDQPQQIAGSLLVENTLPEQNRILSHNIKELWVDQINGLTVNELLTNKAHDRPNLHVAGQLIFTKPLTVANYELGDVAVSGNNKWKRSAITNAVEDWQQLGQQVAAVQQRLSEPAFVLEDFELLQQLPLNASHIEMLDKETLAIWHTNSEDVQQVDVYDWQQLEHSFKHNPSLSKRLPPHEKWTASKLEERFGQLAADLTLISQIQMQSLECLAVRKEFKELVIHCLDNNSNNGTIKERIVIPTGHVKQLLSVVDDNGSLLALLGHNAVEFWQWNGSSKLQQRLQIMQAEQMTLAKHEDHLYLAVVTAPPATSVHIYRSDNWSELEFQLEQVFDLEEAVLPRHLSFMQLHQSKDLLLCLSNATPTQSLRIYQHQGVTGFQQILGNSTLPGAKLLKTLQMPVTPHQLLALANSDGLYLVAPQFTRL